MILGVVLFVTPVIGLTGTSTDLAIPIAATYDSTIRSSQSFAPANTPSPAKSYAAPLPTTSVKPLRNSPSAVAAPPLKNYVPPSSVAAAKSKSSPPKPKSSAPRKSEAAQSTRAKPPTRSAPRTAAKPKKASAAKLPQDTSPNSRLQSLSNLSQMGLGGGGAGQYQARKSQKAPGSQKARSAMGATPSRASQGYESWKKSLAKSAKR